MSGSTVKTSAPANFSLFFFFCAAVMPGGSPSGPTPKLTKQWYNVESQCQQLSPENAESLCKVGCKGPYTSKVACLSAVNPELEILTLTSISTTSTYYTTTTTA